MSAPPSNNTANSSTDILFLYRTGKKKRYFNFLIGSSFADLCCASYFYHNLPQAHSEAPPLSQQQIEHFLWHAEQELFNARTGWAVALLRPILLAIRKRQLLSIYPRLYSLLQRLSPKLILVWNGHKYQDNILHLANASVQVPVAFFENGVLPNSTTLDFKGINALNSVPRDPRFFAQRAQPAAKNWEIKGRQYIRKGEPSDMLPQRYLLVPLQLDRDSQVLFNSSWINSMAELFAALVRALQAAEDKDLHIVFRPHPSAKSQHKHLQEQVAQNERLHWNASAGLQEAIDRAEAIVTINSSVGMEALLRDKKVIVLGQAFYAIEGLCLRAANHEQLLQSINDLPHFAPDMSLAGKFVDYLETDYVVEGNWQQASAQHAKKVREKINQHTNFSAQNQNANQSNIQYG